MKEFAERLKELRLEKELSLDMVVYDLDKRFSVELTKSHLSRWENNKNDPSIRYAAALAKYYNVSLDYLLGLTDSRTPADLLVRKRKAIKSVLSRFSFVFDNLCVEILKRALRGKIFSFRIGLTVCQTNQK